MDTSPENSLMNFDLDLLLGPASASYLLRNAEGKHREEAGGISQNLESSKTCQVHKTSLFEAHLKSSHHTGLKELVTQKEEEPIKDDGFCPSLSYQLLVSPDHDSIAQDVGANGNTDYGNQTQNVKQNDLTGYHYQYATKNDENNESTSPFETFETTNHKYKIQGMRNLRTAEQNLDDKNEENSKNIDYGHLAQNIGNELIHSSQFNDKFTSKVDYDLLWADYQALKKQLASIQPGQVNDDFVRKVDYDLLWADYETLKKQFAKIASDYASLFKENKEHAMQSLNTNTKYENSAKREADIMAKYVAMDESYQKLKVDFLALRKQLLQFNSRDEALTSEIADLKEKISKNQYIGKERRTHTNIIKTQSEHLCLFACVLMGRKQLDKECNRLMRKYCKYFSSKMKKSSIETENIESESIDTGRGSSMTFSDGDRSYNNSPYSLPISPFSIGITTPHIEQTKKTRDFSTSPTPMIKTFDTSTSPIIFEEVVTSTPAIKSCDVATNTLIYHEANTVPKTKIVDFATSPIKFTDVCTSVTKTKTLDAVTSPIMFANMITPEDKTFTAKINTVDIAVSPVMFADTTTLVTKIVTMNIATSPIEFADTMTPLAKTKTLDSAVSPIMFADTVVSSPVDHAGARISAAKTRPSNTENTDSPMMPVNAKSPEAATKILNLFSCIEQVAAKVPTPLTMLDVARPIECTSAGSPVLNNSTQLLKPIAFVPSSCNTGRTEDYKEKLNEIVSKQSNQPQEDLENDLEIKFIFSKYRLDWDVLSPISVTPEDDQGRKHIQSESKEEKEQSSPNKKEVCNNSDLTLAQSLYLSEDEQSENEFNRDDRHISDLDVENPEHVETGHNVSDYMKSTVKNADTDSIKQNNTTLIIENLVPESPSNENANEDHVKSNKTHKSSSKNQKLTKLQKKLKANIPKTKIKSESINKLRPQPFSIDSIKYSAAALSLDKRRDCQMPEVNAKKLLDKTQDIVEVCQENIKASYEELPQNLKETQKSMQKVKDALDIVGPTETVCKSTETQSKNIIVTPHLPTNLSADSDAKSKRCFVTETQSDSTNGISHLSTKSPDNSDINVRLCISSKSSSNSECELPKAQFNRPPQCSQRLDLPIELVTESNYTYPNPTTKRISRVRKDILTISPSVPTDQTENNQRCTTITTNLPLKRTAGDLSISDKCDVKKKKTRMNQQNIAKEQAIRTRVPTANPVSTNKYESEGYQQKETSYTPSHDVSNVDSIILPKSLNHRKMHIDYSDIDMFDTQNVCKSMETSEIRNNPVSNNKNDSEGHQQNDTSYTQEDTWSQEDVSNVGSLENRREMHIDYSDSDMFDTQNVCKSMETNEIRNNPASNNKNDSEGHQRNDTSYTQEGTSSKDAINNDSVILAKSQNHQKKYADYSDINMFDIQNVCKSMNISEITSNKNDSESYQQNASSHTQEGTLSQDGSNNDSVILAKSSNDRNMHYAGHEDSEPWKKSLLDRMIYRYASKPETQMIPKGNDEIAKKIQNGIEKCVKNMPEQKDYLTSVKQLVNELKPYENKVLVFGLMTYLKDPARLSEFVIVSEVKKGYNVGPSASKTEIALIDVFQSMKEYVTDIWDLILDMSEFILFQLETGASPCFAVVESVGHFFANICKYRNDPCRLWLFMLNAMYCFSFKAIPLIKHCLDVVPEIIPHSRTCMETAREPLIRCFVFLLTYYNCNDRFRRIDEIRRRLKYRYNYKLQDENETTLLFFLKKAIIQLADVKTEKLILELVFLIVAKRQGTKWSHRNIILKILLPMLDNDEVSCTAKRFCITTMGCILKPYNNEMLVHTEIVVNTLIGLFELPSQTDMIKDDIVRSLLSMDLHTLVDRIDKCLLDWNPQKVSQELENAMKVYVNRKKSWKSNLLKYYEKTLR